MPVARNGCEWIWLATNQPIACPMARSSYFWFSGQWLKFKDRRPIRIEFLHLETVLYKEL